MKQIDFSRVRAFFKPVVIFLAALVVASSQPVLAAPQDEFCAGFEEGYRSIKGSMVLLPLCPLAPLTPLGSTPFREGIKAGIREALKR
ncbi:MAG: hypothetical protein ACK5XZ_09360 [Hyphomonadaceae bacterium]|jgi:hypothetical protein